MALFECNLPPGSRELLPGSLVGQRRRDIALALRHLIWAQLSGGGLRPPARPSTLSLLRSPVTRQSPGSAWCPAGPLDLRFPRPWQEWGPLPAARGPPLLPRTLPGSGAGLGLHLLSCVRAPLCSQPVPLAHAFSERGLHPGVPTVLGPLRSLPHAPRLWAGVAVPVSESTDKGTRTQTLIFSQFWRPGVQGRGPGQLGVW